MSKFYLIDNVIYSDSSKQKLSNSPAWFHFTKKEGNRAECKYCKVLISYAGGSYGNMKRHLKNKHPTISMEKTTSRSRSPLNVSRLSSVPAKSTLRPESVASISTSDSSESLSEVDSLCQNSDLLDCKSEPFPLKCESRQSSQSSLTGSVKLQEPLSAPQKKQIDLQLLRMICKEHYPFSILDGKELKTFVELLNPNYQLPRRETLINRILPQLCENIRCTLKLDLNSATSVALTTDGWTSSNNQSFMAITAHYLNEEIKLCSCLLGCLEITQRHTPQNLANFLKTEVAEWGIQHKISAIVTGSAANIVAAAKLCQYSHIACFSHLINLIVKEGIAPITDLIEKVKSFVQYLKKNSFALQKLKETQQKMKLPSLKLMQELKLNSLFDMLMRVFQNKIPINSTLAIHEFDEYKLTIEEWKVIENSTKLLEFFNEFVIEISLEKTVSLSKIELFAHLLLEFLNNFKSIENLPPQMKEMSEELVKLVEERLVNDVPEIVGQATLLDPRFKKDGFPPASTKCKQAYDGVISELQLIINNEKQEEHTSSSCLNINQSCKRSPTNTGSNLWKDFDRKVAEANHITDSKSLAIRELDKYLFEMLLPRDRDPLLWWEKRKLIYPNLYKLAMKTLCIPAISMACEKAFSKAEKTLNGERNRLGPKSSQIIFINGNL